MASVNWTKDQKKAIDGRKGTMLVSAAAGSGKTAVLVERVIRRLCDTESPCGVENLLIVTFTNAAAAQMKEKIYKAISKSIALDPKNKELRRQQLMLPYASICTIDSFCIGLVRENFHALGISPDFSLLDEGRLAIIRSEAATKIIEGLYEKNSPEFMKLCSLLSNDKDDRKLFDMILELYELSQAYPFPEEWLDSLAKEFEEPKLPNESVWGKQLIGFMREYAASTVNKTKYCLERLGEEPELEEKYMPVFSRELAMFADFLSVINDGDWERIRGAYHSLSFERMPAAPRGYNSEVKELCKGVREAYKKELSDFEEFMAVSCSDDASDLAQLAPIIRELINAVILFGREFKKLKQEENGADFSDTLHLALRLLTERTESGYRKTELAKELSEKYAEILVDEYQDVNLAQDMIFSAVSKNETNLFMVGDVKQSIYGFRQAMPEIFLNRRDCLEEYEADNYPAKVTLGKNFRSRKGVTQTVNFIFSQLMSKKAGGLDYDEHEYLEAAAAFPENEDADTELYLFESTQDDVQAKFAAEYIENAVKNGMQISVGESQTRNVMYKDFCILLRSVKKSAKVFTDELARRGIPFECEATDSFTQAPEIMFMTSLLKVIDNPIDDIALLCVLLSPVFGFSPDELAYMRSEQRNGFVYHCIVYASENGNEKARMFLERIEYFRRIAANVKVGELIRRLIEETGYGAVSNAMKDSEKRRANLNRFIDFANSYESSGKNGVSGFVKYIDKISKSGKKISGSSGKSNASDAVSVMTIHKSKGLEFPVCIIGACEKSYGEKELNEDIIISGKSGIGTRIDIDGVKYDTINRKAAYFEKRATNRSEELRVLYVALTRPKEKLVLLSTHSNVEKKLLSLYTAINANDTAIDPWSVMGMTSYSDLILTALMRHPDAHCLRNAAGVSSDIVCECGERLKANIIYENNQPAVDAEYPEHETQAREDEPCEPVNDGGILAGEIEKRLCFEYPFGALDGIVAKRIASNLDTKELCGEYFASARPSFVGKNKLTPAQRGVATHRFMQYADYARAKASVDSELERLVKEGMLTETEADAVEKKAISLFFSSKLAQRIISAEKVYKEFAFICAIPVREMYPELKESVPSEEVVIVEGVTDCAFVEDGKLVIVDYKTDRAENAGQLVSEYSEQLATYRRCLSEVLDIEVKETLIYSFRLSETIEVK